MEDMEDGYSSRRVVIERVSPEIDGGRFAVKRIAGDIFTVEADIFADGHDVLSAVLLHRREDSFAWKEVPMRPMVNDRWRGSFTLGRPGTYRYAITAWIDSFMTWQQNLKKKVAARQHRQIDFIEGALLIEEAARRAGEKDSGILLEWAQYLRDEERPRSDRTRLARSRRITRLMGKYPDRRPAVTCPKELQIVADRPVARFGSWYEMFPRSCAAGPGKHGTFQDCEKRLPYIAEMGFDILYLPPVHPVGLTNRKGKNNSTAAKPGDPGTPWAIGSKEGGHKTVHPQLGTLADFRRLMKKASGYGIEIALDIALQCSPDHPYVSGHPEWFRRRPDGSVQYAENPPKKYEDIYPIDFETGNRRKLWEELKSIFEFWIKQGVRIFRVDNPHTKPFAFWEWLITDIKSRYPEVIFLSEAFTRPKVMYRLAKLGFSQSYTYFTWRNLKWELTEYLTELTGTEVKEFFRPNFWPNTPDILSDYLRDGGRPAFMTRLVLAATLATNYGIYGPAFELCENRRRDNESEEYLNSEKYELKHWDIENPDSLKSLITLVNGIRRQNPALQTDSGLRFHNVDNDRLICYSKHAADFSSVILVAVNLDYRHRQSGRVEFDPGQFGLDSGRPYEVRDLLAGVSYQWQGSRNYIELDPLKMPAHIFRVSREVVKK
jgi:starch synthase (maltosyl-transferring)